MRYNMKANKMTLVTKEKTYLVTSIRDMKAWVRINTVDGIAYSVRKSNIISWEMTLC